MYILNACTYVCMYMLCNSLSSIKSKWYTGKTNNCINIPPKNTHFFHNLLDKPFIDMPFNWAKTCMGVKNMASKKCAVIHTFVALCKCKSGKMLFREHLAHFK